jgi:hypothetical protein
MPHCAADLLGIAPDNLRVVADITPITRGADGAILALVSSFAGTILALGPHAVLKLRFLTRAIIDRICIGAAPTQVFAAGSVWIMLEFCRLIQVVCPFLGISGQFSGPGQRRDRRDGWIFLVDLFAVFIVDTKSL